MTGTLKVSRPRPPWMATTLAFARHLNSRFVEDRCLAAAASLSYTSLLALVPLVAIGFAVLSAFPAFESAQEEIQAFVFKNFVPSAVETVQSHLAGFIEKARGLTAIGVIGLAVTALLLFNTIETALNLIFRVTSSRSVINRLLVFWAMLSLGPLLAASGFSVATAFYADAAATSGLSSILDRAAQGIPTLLSILAFAFLYKVVPNRPVRFRHALIGAAVAGIAFTLLRWGFTIYVTRFPSYQNLYGTLATIPIFLFWMYLSWAVVLIGAVITAALPDWGRRTGSDASALSPSRRLRLATAILDELYNRAQTGGVVTEEELLAAVDAPERVVGAMLVALREAQLVECTETGDWLAARDPAVVTLNDLVRALDLELDRDDGVGREPAWSRPELTQLIGQEVQRRRQALDLSLRDILVKSDDGGPTTSTSQAIPLHRAP